MTPGELRRLARLERAGATALIADADLLRVQAVALDGMLDPLVPMSQRVWTGPAALDFEHKARSFAAMLAGEARRLHQIAEDLDRQAQQRRRKAAEFEAQASVLEQAEVAAATAPGVA